MDDGKEKPSARDSHTHGMHWQVNNEAITQMDSLRLMQRDIQSVIMYVSWECAMEKMEEGRTPKKFLRHSKKVCFILRGNISEERDVISFLHSLLFFSLCLHVLRDERTVRLTQGKYVFLRGKRLHQASFSYMCVCCKIL